MTLVTKPKRLPFLLFASLLTPFVHASERAQPFNIPPQPLDGALNALGEKTGLQLSYPGTLSKGLKSPGLSGQATPREALDRLLQGTGLAYRYADASTVTLERKAAVQTVRSPAETAVMPTLPTVTVTGKTIEDDHPYNPNYNRSNAFTATKTDTPLMDTPVSVQVVPKQVLQDQQAYRLQDAVKNVSGVQQRFSGGGYDRFMIRGFDSDQVQYRNGVRLRNLNFDLANVAQVEVLKGPASVLYGRAEPGGLINTVTKRPQAQPYYALEQRFGSYGYYRTQVDATGPITADGNLAYGFDLSYLSAGSFRDYGGNDRVFVAPALAWRPTEKTEFNLSVEYLNEDRVYDSGIPMFGTQVAKVPINRQYDQPGLKDNRENVLVDFNWSHSFDGNWKFRNGVVANWLRQNFNELYSDSITGRTISRYSWFGKGNTDMHTVYANLSGKFDTWGINHDVLLGGEYYVIDEHELDKVYDMGTIDLFKPVFPNIDFNTIRAQRANTQFVQNESWYGLYFQDQITLWDNWHLMGGGRYDWATISSGYDDPSVFKTDTLHDSQFSPRVGLLYRPQDWLSVYGQWVESFGSNNGRSQTGKPFQPQTATQYEAGIKTELFGGRLTSSLAYFHITKNNLVTNDPDNPRFSVAIGEARSQGVELDISGKITDGLNLIATYAYTDTEITKDYSGIAGKRLPYVPLHSGSVWLKYEFQQQALQGLSVGGGVFLADQRYGNTDNTIADSGYARVDLYAAYRHKLGPTHLTTQLNLNNVTDTEYFILRSRANNLPAEPLTVIGSLKLEY